MHTTLNDVLNRVEQLSIEQQETLVEIVRHRLIEERRKEISDNAAATLKAIRSGKAKRGSVKDLRKALGE